jgi:hypothetical protein
MAIPEGVSGDGVVLILALDLLAPGTSALGFEEALAYMASDFQDVALDAEGAQVVARAPEPTPTPPAPSTPASEDQGTSGTPGAAALVALTGLGLAAWVWHRRV